MNILPAYPKSYNFRMRAPSYTGGSRQKKKIELLETKKERRPDMDSNGLLCRQCGCVITSRAEQIAVNGSVSHTFANPAGIVFEIECYKNAAGCGITGRLSDEFTWFTGYSWQVCLCSSCFMHMGWRFISNSRQTFFALISDRLVDSGRTAQ